VVVHSQFNAGIDSVARVLEVASDADDPLFVAWRDRMTFRLGVHRDIVARIAADGSLADGWTVDRAAELFHSITLPSVWRELTQHLGWTADEYIDHLTKVLHGAFIR
jgi:hypothetical protein